MSEIWLTLDGNGPRFRQLYRAIREAIRSGALPRGARAPSTRALATDLGLSRTTVLLAYEQLAAEGYLSGRHGSGSYVRAPAAPAPTRTRPARARTRAPRLSRLGTTLLAPHLRPLLSTYVSERRVLPYDFRYGAPSIGDFPIRAWQRALTRRARRASARSYDYGHPQGSPALRDALAAYLHRARGVPTDPAHILSAVHTLLAFARDPKHLGGELGITMVLHTWGKTPHRARPLCGDGRRPQSGWGALVVFVPAFDKELARRNRARARRWRKPGQPVVYVEMSHLNASRLEGLKLTVA